VVLIGSDSPDLPTELMDQAFASLLQTPVVVGPAADGGYYLIGIAASSRASDLTFLFDDMPWSTPAVLSETLERLECRGVGYHLLPPWRDVDEWEDLVALYRRLSQPASRLDEMLAALSADLKHCIALHTTETT
jgi:glycosyltransferase A (GT-A) superfamily protein (DUF2064 family)